VKRYGTDRELLEAFVKIKDKLASALPSWDPKEFDNLVSGCERIIGQSEQIVKANTINHWWYQYPTRRDYITPSKAYPWPLTPNVLPQVEVDMDQRHEKMWAIFIKSIFRTPADFEEFIKLVRHSGWNGFEIDCPREICTDILRVYVRAIAREYRNRILGDADPRLAMDACVDTESVQVCMWEELGAAVRRSGYGDPKTEDCFDQFVSILPTIGRVEQFITPDVLQWLKRRSDEARPEKGLPTDEVATLPARTLRSGPSELEMMVDGFCDVSDGDGEQPNLIEVCGAPPTDFEIITQTYQHVKLIYDLFGLYPLSRNTDW